MSISTANRTIALQALAAFEKALSAFESAKSEKKEKVKDYGNAVQKAMLLLGTQSLKRMVLYISSQMGKEKKADGDEENKINAKDKAGEGNHVNAWRCLYDQLAHFSGIDEEIFQYKIVSELTKEQTALKEEDIAFFLLCLKRLANAKWAEMETKAKKKLTTKQEDTETHSSHA